MPLNSILFVVIIAVYYKEKRGYVNLNYLIVNPLWVTRKQIAQNAQCSF
jgi:hypothetical protein